MAAGSYFGFWPLLGLAHTFTRGIGALLFFCFVLFCFVLFCFVFVLFLFCFCFVFVFCFFLFCFVFFCCCCWFFFFFFCFFFFFLCFLFCFVLFFKYLKVSESTLKPSSALGGHGRSYVDKKKSYLKNHLIKLCLLVVHAYGYNIALQATVLLWKRAKLIYIHCAVLSQYICLCNQVSVLYHNHIKTTKNGPK